MSMPITETPGILDAIAGFATHLRDHGLAVGIPEQQAMVQAAAALGSLDARPLKSAWRAIACHGASDWRKYPDLYQRYWQADRLQGSTRTSGMTRPRRDLRQIVQTLQSEGGDATSPQRPGGDTLAGDAPSGVSEQQADTRAQGGASRTEALENRDFALWLPQDLARLERIVDAIARRLRKRLMRRWQAHARGRRLDVRHTLRASLRTGGEPVAPAWRRARRERPRVFVLVDVSRSMETHAQFFLRVARAFVGVLDARVFVFHTRLAEVTPLLQRDSARVQEKVNAVTAGFAGGTRIATSIGDFVDVHARAGLNRGARVLILSDGYDSDPPDELAAQLARLRGKGVRLSWLHPTAMPPASQALVACAGLIERYAPLHDLASLERAGALLT
ncbi:MAG: VWA domain-containing protein [Proteobacteria bacterium]|nr:VWA domain-containing protein [Pseudomonadota bacterium]